MFPRTVLDAITRVGEVEQLGKGLRKATVPPQVKQRG